MTEQEVDEIKARLDYLEAAMAIERLNGYMPYADFKGKMPDGLPPEVAELAAAGKGPKAAMQLAKIAGISPPFAQGCCEVLSITAIAALVPDRSQAPGSPS